MKRVGNLMPQICDPDNLRWAFWRAARGKWQREEVQTLSVDLDDNLRWMRARLLQGDFPLGQFVRFKIPTIDQSVLLRLIKRRFKDNRLLALFERIVQSYQTEPGKGLPIGALTSQHFANFYLAGLDRFVKETLQIHGYVRYMDDFVAWSNEKSCLKNARHMIRRHLNQELCLQPKPTPFINRTTLGMDFLGYRLWPNGTRLTRRNRQRLLRRIRAYGRALAKGIMAERDYQQRVGSIVAFVDETGSLAERARVFVGAKGGAQAA